MPINGPYPEQPEFKNQYSPNIVEPSYGRQAFPTETQSNSPDRLLSHQTAQQEFERMMARRQPDAQKYNQPFSKFGLIIFEFSHIVKLSVCMLQISIMLFNLFSSANKWTIP